MIDNQLLVMGERSPEADQGLVPDGGIDRYLDRCLARRRTGSRDAGAAVRARSFVAEGETHAGRRRGAVAGRDSAWVSRAKAASARKGSTVTISGAARRADATEALELPAIVRTFTDS